MENILKGLNNCNTILDNNLKESYYQGVQIEKALEDMSSLNSTSKVVSKQTKIFKRFGFFNISRSSENRIFENKSRKSETKTVGFTPPISLSDPIDKALADLKYKSQLLSIELDSQDKKLQELHNFTDETHDRLKSSYSRIK